MPVVPPFAYQGDGDEVPADIGTNAGPLASHVLLCDGDAVVLVAGDAVPLDTAVAGADEQDPVERRSENIVSGDDGRVAVLDRNAMLLDRGVDGVVDDRRGVAVVVDENAVRECPVDGIAVDDGIFGVRQQMPCAPEPVFCTMLPMSCAPSLALILIAESSATVVTTVLPVSVALELPSSMRMPLTCAVSTVQF